MVFIKKHLTTYEQIKRAGILHGPKVNSFLSLLKQKKSRIEKPRLQHMLLGPKSFEIANPKIGKLKPVTKAYSNSLSALLKTQCL